MFIIQKKLRTPNVAVKWLASLLCFRKVPPSNLSLRIFEVFRILAGQMKEYYLKLGHDSFLLYPFQFIIH
jgi:hypothetical protein